MVYGTDPACSANALLHACRRPWEVEMDDYGGVLEVDAFAEQVGGEEEVDAFDVARRSGDHRLRCKAPQEFGAGGGAAGEVAAASRERGGSRSIGQAGEQGPHGICELGEGDDFFTAVRRAQLVESLGAFGIGPRAGERACAERGHRGGVSVDDVAQRLGEARLGFEQLGKGQLYGVVSADPGAECGAGRVASGSQGGIEGGGDGEAAIECAQQGAEARRPLASETPVDEGAAVVATAGWEWWWERGDLLE